jgi:cytochrome P450
MVPRSEGDFVELYAFPFPAIVIGELLGVPPGARDDFRRWSLLAVSALTGGDLAAYEQAKGAIGDVIEVEVAARERQLAEHDPPEGRQPVGTVVPDDVCSLLAVACREGVLSREEMRHLGYQLLVAGHETTTSLLGLMLYRLLERPDVMARLRGDPALIPQAVEEALRFDSPVQGLFRTNAGPAELAGTTLPPRTKVQMLFGSANRDAEQWPAADEFRVDRDANELRRHVAFGWGIHYCIGAPLARLEARLTFERILARMDDIQLAGPPQRTDSYVLRGLTSLPLRWTARAG